MRRALVNIVMLLLQTATLVAQTPSSDSQITLTMLTEIRQLRKDLQSVAATIQRVQIVMYRVQAQATVLDRVTERLELARSGCKQAHEQRKMVTSQIEQAEARKRISQNLSDQRAAEEVLSELKSSIQMWDGNAQQCETEQADLETQFRAEQAKMNDLQDQLDKLDRLLAGTSK